MYGIISHVCFFLGADGVCPVTLGQDLMRSWWLLCRGWRAGCALEALIGRLWPNDSLFVFFSNLQKVPMLLMLVFPTIIHFDRVVNYINHPFWGIPILETPMCFSCVMKKVDWSTTEVLLQRRYGSSDSTYLLLWQARKYHGADRTAAWYPK